MMVARDSPERFLVPLKSHTQGSWLLRRRMITVGWQKNVWSRPSSLPSLSWAQSSSPPI